MGKKEDKKKQKPFEEAAETVETAGTGETPEEEMQEETAKEEGTSEAEAAPEGTSEQENTAAGNNAFTEKIAALEDRVKRQMAEFDNFRKRTEREKEQRFSMGEKNVIEKMLPVVDNFERGLKAIPEEEKGGALASGMEMIYKQMMKQLEDLGVKPIEAVGREFDPNFHNAVMQVDTDEYESGIVAQEFQKGYLYHDSVLRHSMVGVAK